MEGCLVVVLEKHAVLQSPSQIESLVQIFLHATKVCGWMGLVWLTECLLIIEVDGDGLLGYGQ